MGILTNTCVVVITLEAFDHYSGKTMFCVILQAYHQHQKIPVQCLSEDYNSVI